MPDYNVYYCMIKPVTVMEGRGLTGQELEASPEVPEAVVRRGEILQQFETILQQLFQNSVPHIPREDSRGYTVHVHRIPTSPAGVPDYAGLNIHIREPIVYLVSSLEDDCAAGVPPVRQRPSYRLVEALSNYPDEFPSSFLSSTSNSISTDTSNEQGHALMISPYAPQVAETYSHVLTEASNWIAIMARMLAKTSFHEIAHCKAECENRRVATNPANRRWLEAISGSIHDVPDVSVMTIPLGPNTSVVDADYQLMGQHMLCPVRFYKHGIDVDSQFFLNGSDHDLDSTAEQAAAAPAPTAAPAPAGDPLADLNI